MALNTTVLRELRRELECLKADRATVDARIDALTRILESSEVYSPPGPKSRRGGSRASTPAAASARPSLRASILGALKHLPKATPAELTRHLQEIGVQVGGATSLRERVWHELSRLRKRGFVRRTRRGYYQVSPLKPSTQPAAATPGDLRSDIAAVN